MQHPKINNNHGMTLVELLAALALFSIVIVLAGSLITSIGSSEKSVSSDVSLQQNTNVLMSEIRQAYYNGTNTGDLQFDLDTNKFDIKNDEIKNGGRDLDIVNSSYIENVNYDEPLFIKLTTFTEGGQEVTVDTTLKQTKTEQIVLNEDDSQFCDSDYESDYEWEDIDEVKKLPCNSEGNVKWEGKKYEQNCKKGNSEDPYHVNGSLLVTGRMEHSKQEQGGEINVDKDFCATDQVTLKNSFSITVDGSGTFRDMAELKNSASISVDGSAHFHGKVYLKKDATISIGTATFDKQVDLKKDALISIVGAGSFYGNVTGTSGANGGDICVDTGFSQRRTAE